MKLVHESIVQRREIFETIWARLFEAFKKEDLSSRVQLFKELAELGHGVTSRWDTQNIMNEPFDKLLLHILAIKVAVGEFT